MLAADDFKLGDFMQNVGTMAAGVGKKYLLPALRTAFPAYG